MALSTTFDTFNSFKVDILYKKLLGVPDSNPGQDPSVEQGSSRNGVFPNQIYAQTIPPTINNPSIPPITEWTYISSYSFNTSANITSLSSGTINFPTGTKKYTNTTYPYIAYYQNLVLTDTTGTSNSKISFYSLDSNAVNSNNLLKYAIPTNYDLTSSNSYNALNVFDCKGVPIPSYDTNYPWVFDPDSGILTFYKNALTSLKSPPVMSFIRYEGALGGIATENFVNNAINAASPTGVAFLSSASTTFSGNVSISSTTASSATNTGALTVTGGLGVAGNIYAGGTIDATTFNATSDYRIKDNVLPLNDSFIVDNLRPVQYYNKLSKGEDIGLIAHELQEHYPNLVTGIKDGDGYQSVNYTGLIPILIHEIKTMKKELKQLHTELDEIKNK
jgi:hypothetical protein